MYSIEKNIPIPDPLIGRGKVYPFDEMEVGDSFLVPFREKGKKSTRSRVAQSCVLSSKKSGRKYTIRTLESAVRVWRTE